METFEPVKVWRNYQQLVGELSKFRSFRKSIEKSASGAESLQWWESNAERVPEHCNTIQQGGESAQLARAGEGGRAAVVGAHREREGGQKMWVREECRRILKNGARRMLTRGGWAS